MVDNGFSIRQTLARLSRLNRQPEQITAILVTHEHADHCAGIEAFGRKYNIPVWASYGTAMVMQSDRIQSFDSHQGFAIDAIQVTPVAVPHDAREPTQFVFDSEGFKLGVLTDVGSLTAHIRQAYSGCDALVLECNYDPVMLRNGEYPASLKQRVDGDWGHLSNQQASELLSQLDQSRLQQLVLAHLSEKNNRPELALQAIESAIQKSTVPITIAAQDEGFDWLALMVSEITSNERALCCS